MSWDHLLYSQADLKLDPVTLDPHLKKAFCKLCIPANQILFSESSKSDSWISLETQQLCVAAWAKFLSAMGSSHNLTLMEICQTF